MNKYNNSLVYKIKCHNPKISEFYVGSTTNFKSRASAHKSAVSNSLSYKYKFIADNGGWSNWAMTIIKRYSCETKQELENHEKYWICAFGAKLNKQMPNRKAKESKMVHYIKNRECIIKKKKEHFQCACGGSYSLVNKARHFKTDTHQHYINISELPESDDTYPSDSSN